MRIWCRWADRPKKEEEKRQKREKDIAVGVLGEIDGGSAVAMGEVGIKSADIGGIARRMRTAITVTRDIDRPRDRGLVAEIQIDAGGDLALGLGVPMPGKKITEAVGWTALTRLVNAVGAMNEGRTKRMLTADVNSQPLLRLLLRNFSEKRHATVQSEIINSMLCDERSNCSLRTLTRPQPYSSSWPVPAPPDRSGMAIMFTTILVQPVKCCVRCPLPVAGLYCSQANPVFFHSRKTFSTRFLRNCEYISRAWSW